MSVYKCLRVHCQCGCTYAQALTQKESVAKKKAAMSSDIAKALARLSSGLYVVTADSKGAKGAMVGLPAVMPVSPCAYFLHGVPLRTQLDSIEPRDSTWTLPLQHR